MSGPPRRGGNGPPDASDEVERLAAPKPKLPLVEFLESLNMEGLDLAREPDVCREVEL